MKAVAYCRVSTNEADQLNSLQNQLQHYTELFKQQKFEKVNVGVYYTKDGQKTHLDGIFADEGITGTKKKNRKAYEYMLKCAANKEFDIIYVKNVQRFARNVEDGAGDLKRLKQLGIKVIFEDGNLNYHEHEAVINMFLSIAQEESQMKSRACKFGIRKAQQQGKWTSNCPYGYDRVNGYLQVNDKEAEIVRKIYHFYVDKGWGHNKIGRWLDDNNISTKKGGIWRQQHIRTILTNPLYKGVQITHKTENMDVNVFIQKEIPEYEWIKHSKDELKIIEESLWQQAQDIYKRRNEEFSRRKHRHSDVNLLSTVCICGNCGGILKRKRKRTKVKQRMVYLDKYEWVCQNNDMYGARKCKFRNAVDEDILIKFCKEKIEEYRKHKEILENNLKHYLDLYYDLDTTSKLSQKNEELTELEAEKQHYIKLNMRGTVTFDELDVFMDEYRTKKSKLENELIKLKNIDKEIEEVRRQFNDYIKYIDSVDINNLTNADLKRIFYKVSVFTLENVCVYENDVKNSFYNQIHQPYNYYNFNKEELKMLSAEHMFMNISEGKIFEDLAERDIKEWEQNAVNSNA